MIGKKVQRLAAVGAAVVGLGAWGTVAAVNANAADGGCWERSFSAGNAFYAHVEWCGNGDPNTLGDITSRYCTQPNGYSPCEFRNEWSPGLVEAVWFYGHGGSIMVQATVLADGNAIQHVPA